MQDIGWAYERGYEIKGVPDFPGYEVTTDGDVIGLRGRLLVQSIDGNGRFMVGLHRGGKTYTRRVHTLVMLAFIGPPPIGMEIRHLNGDHLDNRLDNLKYGTRTENARDRVRHGTQLCGERHHFSKLTEIDVREIRAQLAAGKSGRSVAKQFGVADITVSNIKKRKTWRHI